MLETIDARATVRYAPSGLGQWHFRRSASGGTSYTHPEPPAGVSLCTYSRTPDGLHRVRVEANLTALLHGPAKACYSLAPDELPAALTAFLGVSEGLLVGAGLPAASGWDVHRLDPSQTFALPEHVACSEVVVASHRAFRLMANPRQVVSLHNDQTATFRSSKWRSVMVYDKGAEARSRGVEPPTKNLLRVEHRIRPRTASGEWKDMSPNLEQVEQMQEQVGRDSVALLESLSQKIVAGGQLSIIRLLMRGGASLNTALRLASVMLLHQEFGAGVFESLGAATSSSERWRSEVRRYVAAAGGEDSMLEDLGSLIATMAPVFARDHDVKITKKPKKS